MSRMFLKYFTKHTRIYTATELKENYFYTKTSTVCDRVI